MAENIIVVAVDELKKHLNLINGFIPLSQEAVDELYDAVDAFGMERDKAENDPAFKQFIAYTIIKSGDRFLTYRRGSSLGEARLHGNRSIGIGGHIDFGDNANLFLDDFLKVAALREVDEEVKITEKHDLHLVGLLNDDSNEVGKVHLGLVYVTELEKAEVKKREKGIAQITFATIEELEAERDQFETWSQLLIDNLATIS